MSLHDYFGNSGWRMIFIFQDKGKKSHTYNLTKKAKYSFFQPESRGKQWWHDFATSEKLHSGLEGQSRSILPSKKEREHWKKYCLIRVVSDGKTYLQRR